MQEKTILVVDDSPHLRRMLGLMLRAAGLTVLTAENGSEALAVAREQRPDLVIMDVMMPDMDGYETCAALRAEIDVPVIFLSGFNRDVAKIQALNQNQIDYMTKPFLPRQLVERIRMMLANHSAPPLLC